MDNIGGNSSPSSGLMAEALPHIDLNLLTQSELQALSLCSDSVFDSRREDDQVVISDVDRFSVNDPPAAGSPHPFSRPGRRHYRSRLPSFIPVAPKPNLPIDREDETIIRYLKHSRQNPNSDTTPPPQHSSAQPQPAPHAGERKKSKRGRKTGSDRKFQEKRVEVELEMVNENGVMIDFEELEKCGDGVYGEELRKRTVGMESEEDLLRFMGSLKGDWCSRKRRKYVDVGEFGDALPVGWKVVLALKRRHRDGHFLPYFRRYISPSGEQFPSCKEVSSFLRSQFMSCAANQNVGAFHTDDDVNRAIVLDSSQPSSATETHGNEICLEGTDNLIDVQIQDIFDCHICNLRFHEHIDYAQHRFLFHQNTATRYKNWPTLAEGVIMKDGKYGCQFCPKVFDERLSYIGHVGSHSRRNIKRSAAGNVMAKTNASVEIAPNIVSEIPPVAANTIQGMNPVTGPRDEADFGAQTAVDVELTLPRIQRIGTDEEMVNPSEVSMNSCEHPELGNVINDGTAKYGVSLGNKLAEPNMTIATSETLDLAAEGNVSQKGITASIPISQSLTKFSTLASESNKEKHEASVVSPNLENEAGFKGSSLPGASVGLVNHDTGKEEDVDSSLGLDSGVKIFCQIKTVCVWCKKEFSLEMVSETPPDSTGYMCSNCKTIITGFNGGTHHV